MKIMSKITGVTLSAVLLIGILFSGSVMADPVNSTDKKGLTDNEIAEMLSYPIADESILFVVLTHGNSINGQKATPQQYSDIDAESVENVSTITDEAAYQQVQDQYKTILEFHIKGNGKDKLAKEIKKLSKRKEVESVTPDYVYHLIDEDVDSDTSDTTMADDNTYNDEISEETTVTTNTNETVINEPNIDSLTLATAPLDTYYSSKQYSILSQINVESAWNVTKGSKNVRVGIMDSGIANHPDLNANLVTGYDFVHNNNVTNDDIIGHGTHVAGICGAVGNNNTGVSGICWNVSLVPLQVTNDNKTVNTDAVIHAIPYASNNNIPIINCSIADGGYDATFEQAINNYPGLFVCASGNGDANKIGVNNDATKNYPSSYSCTNIIAVGAIDMNDNITSYSNYGISTVDLFAPGNGILSTYPETMCDNGTHMVSTHYTRGYHYDNGTSMACPMVTGVAALIASIRPDLSASMIKWYIINNVRMPAYNLLSNKCVTGGILDAYKAVNAAYLPTTSTSKNFGYLEGVTKSTISGWVWNPSTPNTSINANIIIKKKENYIQAASFSTPADIYRSDLYSKGYGNGSHGFSASVNWANYGIGRYLVELYGSSGGGGIIGSTEYDYFGSLDSVSGTNIIGWATNPDNTSQYVSVIIYIYSTINGSTVKGPISVTANQSYSNVGSHGFNYSINWSGIASGTYNVVAYANISGQNFQLGDPINYTVSPQPQPQFALSYLNNSGISGAVWDQTIVGTSQDAPMYADIYVCNSSGTTLEYQRVYANGWDGNRYHLFTCNFNKLMSEYSPGSYKINVYAICGNNPLVASLSYQVGIVPDGVYRLRNVNSGYYLDIPNAVTQTGTQLQQCFYTASPAQNWRFEVQPDGSYKITSLVGDGNTFVLDDRNMVDGNANPVQICTSNNSTAQRWTVTRNSDGSFCLAAKCAPTRCMEVTNALTGPGASVGIYTYNSNAPCQRWALEEVGIPADGVYHIRNANSRLYMDAEQSNNFNVIQYPYGGNTNQQWRLVYHAAGYYTLENLWSYYQSQGRKMLSVSETDDNVDLYYASDTLTTQRYSLIQSTNGTYTLFVWWDSKVIEVPGGSTSWPADVDKGTNCGYVYQQWYLEVA